MKIDMIFQSMGNNGFLEGKSVKRSEGYKGFTDLFNSKMNNSNEGKESISATTTQHQSNQEATSRLQKDKGNSTELEASHKDDNKDLEDEKVEVEAILQQIHSILFQLQEDAISLEDGTAEIAYLLEGLDLSLLEANIKVTLDNLNTLLLKMETTTEALSLAGDMNLEENTEILQEIKEIKLLIPDIEALLAQHITDETTNNLVPVVPKTSTMEQFDQFNTVVDTENLFETIDNTMVAEVDVSLKDSDKNTRNVDVTEGSEVELLHLEEIAEIPGNNGEVSVEGKQTQYETIPIEEENVTFDTKVLIQEVANKAKLLVQEGKSEMIIKLMPENLGNLFINVSIDKGNVSAKLMAENQQIKEMIDANLDQLRIALGDKGMSITKLEVSVGHNQQDFNGSKFFQQQKGRMKLKRFNNIDEVNGIYSMENLSENLYDNPYMVASKFNGLV